jgi:hypothetical protein
LAESLTKQFREEQESLKREISSKLRSEISILTETMDKRSKDVDIAILDISHRVDTVHEQVNEKMEKEIGITQRRIERVSQEMNTRTQELAINLTEQVSQAEIDSGIIRQEIVELGDRVNSRVTDEVRTVTNNLEDVKNQIKEDKERNEAKFVKFEQEIKAMKGMIAARIDSGSSSAAKRNAELTQVSNVKVSSLNSVNSSTGVSEVELSNNLPSCSEVYSSELSHVGNLNVVNTISEMPLNRDMLNELSLPTFDNCNKQSVVMFLRDLDLYFEVKKIPEKLKLPLVLRAIRDPFAKNWVSAEYQKIDSYQGFKEQFAKLFWNELEQSRVRCDIYQGKYDRREGESMTEHYVRYASLAANLQPPMTEYDIVTALTSHFPMEIQRSMLAANLRTSQEALEFLGRLQSLEGIQGGNNEYRNGSKG